jgi:hypothetical protein
MPLFSKFFFAAGLLAFASPAAAAPATSVAASTTTPASPPSSGWRVVPNTVFAPGEEFLYSVKWGVITGGHSTLAVVGLENVDGRPAYHIVSEAQSVGVVDTFFKVKDKNESWVDKDSLSTVRYEKHIREGKYRVEESGMIDQVLHKFFSRAYRIDKDRWEEKQGDVTPHVLDVLGALYYVRTLPLEVGKSYSFDVHSGKKVWPLLVNVRKRERIKVAAGKFDCLLVEPVLREPGIFISKGKKLEVWMTDDERRIPVKMRSEVVIGHVSADLERFTYVPVK